MFNLANLKGPVYITLSFALPLLLAFYVYEFSGISGLTAWCFFMFVAVHMAYGEGVRRFDTMNSLKAGTASGQEIFWYYMMLGSNLTHFAVLCHVHFLASQWQFPMSLDGSLAMNINALLKLLVIFSMVHYAFRPSVVNSQAADVEYGDRGYWRITKHPLLMHLLILLVLLFLQRIELMNINLWLVVFIMIGIIHQNSRKKEELKGKPGFSLRYVHTAFHEEFFMRAKSDRFVSPIVDLLIIILVSIGTWIGNDHIALISIYVMVLGMSAKGLWYAYGFNASNENYLKYRDGLTS